MPACFSVARSYTHEVTAVKVTVAHVTDLLTGHCIETDMIVATHVVASMATAHS